MLHIMLYFAGYFDQQMRRNLFTSWTSHLQTASVQFRSDLARVEVSTSSAFLLHKLYHVQYVAFLTNRATGNWWWKRLRNCTCIYIVFIPMIIFVRKRIQCFIDFRFYSTYQMRMSGRDGLPTLCLRMTCVQRMPSCWRGSTGTPWSLTRQARPLSSSWTSTKKRVSKRPGKRFQGKCFLLSCLIYMSFLKPSIARSSSTYFLLFSFLDDAFRKNLESAIRFGNPLLVQVGVYLHFFFFDSFLWRGGF